MLKNNAVSVWLVDLDETTAADASLLSPDEMDRAARFRFAIDRKRFVTCRSVLRTLLARYLGIPGAAIRFEYLANGKPRIDRQQNPSPICFNLSHSAQLALIALANNREVGIDIELVLFDVDALALAAKCFSSQEQAAISALSRELQTPAFFACWTRKEAFVKATGAGLAFPLHEFSVPTNPAVSRQSEVVRAKEGTREQWTLQDLHVPTGYRAALVAEGPACQVDVYRWGDATLNACPALRECDG